MKLQSTGKEFSSAANCDLGRLLSASSEIRSHLEDSKGPSRYSKQGCFSQQLLLLLWRKALMSDWLCWGSFIKGQPSSCASVDLFGWEGGLEKSP